MFLAIIIAINAFIIFSLFTGIFDVIVGLAQMVLALLLLIYQQLEEHWPSPPMSSQKKQSSTSSAPFDYGGFFAKEVKLQQEQIVDNSNIDVASRFHLINIK